MTWPSARRDLGIAIVGAGGIVDIGHLPAYRHGELRIVGIYDVDKRQARLVGERHGITQIYPEIAALLSDRSVDVVDIAIPPAQQILVATAAMAAGKHVLCQKPLALNLADAHTIAQQAHASKVKCAVNQQLRFEGAVFGTRRIIDQRVLGEPVGLSVRARGFIDWERRPWTATAGRLELPFHSIHYLDAIRFLMGEPDLVWGAAGRRPGGQDVQGETRVVAAMRFPSGATAVLEADHDRLDGTNESGFTLDASAGTARAQLGWTTPSRLSTFSFSDRQLGWVEQDAGREWLPGSFLGPMASLLDAVLENTEPATSVHDNLRTMALMEAVYDAVETGSAQTPRAMT